ncbi:MAG: hypothetical protein QUS33_05395 [Dehalococcoidia bacterium]|nr:hypothetical protein [Dehalococcoidia bacterium]
MQLHERLMDILGHEVTVTSRGNDGWREIAAGTLKEVGPDYIIVGTIRRDKEDQSEGTVDWWIRSAEILAVIHAWNCPSCLSLDE